MSLAFFLYAYVKEESSCRGCSARRRSRASPRGSDLSRTRTLVVVVATVAVGRVGGGGGVSSYVCPPTLLRLLSELPSSQSVMRMRRLKLSDLSGIVMGR